MAYIHDIAPELPVLGLLSPAGELAAETPAAQRDSALWRRAYAHMRLTRHFDQHAVMLQRTGRLGTYASCLGQEALSTAAGLALAADDVLVPYYRDQAAQLLRGTGMADILRYWGGDERGSAVPAGSQDLPACVPIATQLPHAAGVAAAIKLRREARAVLVTCGDGATSRGDFYEALNLAGVWHLPLVILVNNNQWAISVPLAAQTAARTLAQKAIAAGLPGVRVDGNDVLALHAVLTEALQRARAGKGPTLVEGVTYRLCDHTTADDMSRYADPAQRREAEAMEPLRRLRALLTQAAGWSEDDEAALAATQARQVEAAVADYLATPPPAVTDMFDFLYAALPAELEAPRAQAIARAAPRPPC